MFKISKNMLTMNMKEIENAYGRAINGDLEKQLRTMAMEGLAK